MYAMERQSVLHKGGRVVLPSPTVIPRWNHARCRVLNRCKNLAAIRGLVLLQATASSTPCPDVVVRGVGCKHMNQYMGVFLPARRDPCQLLGSIR